MISINRDSAETLVFQRLREEREGRLADLDVRYMRAIEAGEDTAAIVAEKQALRDITNKSLGSLTLDELASLTLDEALAIKG